MNDQSHWSNGIPFRLANTRESIYYPVITHHYFGGSSGNGGSGGFIPIQHQDFPSVPPPHASPGQLVQNHSVSQSTFIPFARNAQFPNMSCEPTDEEYATLQKLSSEYAPEVEGPLVGERQRSSVVVSQYSEGDPVYQLKTNNLANKYALFRACKGDGLCGWRAIAFGYFEALIKLGNAQRFRDEVTRLRSFEKMMTTFGIGAIVYEDLVESTYNLLFRLASSLPSAGNDELLLEHFNTDKFSKDIITHLKLLTSASMQENRAYFEPFLFGRDVREYCNMAIIPSSSEIDEVSIRALFDLLLKPAGIGLEVSHLDRSPGQEVNAHSYFPSGADGHPLPDFPVVRLLYRPGHYDMLYKVEDTIANPIQSEDSVFVGLATPGDGYKATATGIYGLIPGMSAPKPLNDLSSKPLVNQVPHMIQCQREPMELFAPLHQAATPTYNMSTLSALSSPQQNSKGPFRSSKYENGPGLASINCQNLQTKPLLESPLNRSHYNNDDFQPYIWKPDNGSSSGNTCS